MNVRFPLFFLLICWYAAPAKEYRVNTPNTLASAIAGVKPGDTITVLNGTYSNWAIAFSAKGDSLSPILLRAESAGGVILTGVSSLKIGGNYLVADGFTFTNGYIPANGVIEFRNTSGVYSNHCRLTNTSVIDYSNPDTTIDSKWVSIYGQYNRVDHCFLKGKRNLGTTLVVWRPDTSANYARIDSNYFGPRPPLGLNGGETIRIGTSDLCLSNSFSVVEHNYFEGCNGELEIISSKSCGNIFRFNTFVNCTGTLTLRECHRNSVYNNFFFGDHKSNAGAIRIIGEDNLVYNNYITGLAGTNYRTAITIVNGIPNSPLTGYFQVKRAVVAFNTLVDNANNFNIGVAPDSTATLPPLDCVIANNIIYGTKAPLVAFPTAPINMTWQGNIFYGAATGFAALPANNFVTDPMLTAEDENGVRHLTAVSPAVNAAIGTFDYVRIDMDGQLRDAQKDIGADEYSLQPVVLTPLKASDVGPRKTITAIDGKENSHPVDFELMQNYPNPFNPSTKIAFVLPEHCHVQLTIYDTSGKEALQVFRGELERGYHEFSVDGTGLPSGVYVYRLKTEQGILANKMILLK